MSAVIQQTSYTAEEYLTLERNAPYKSEFHNGQIFAMTGASRKHNLVSINIAAELRSQLKKRPCEAYINDMRVKAAEMRSYYYPDIAVVCGVARFEDNMLDTLLNPTVVIEVLSPSTEAYDRGGKFSHYRKIASLREYLLVAQDQPIIECFTRQENGWVLTETTGLDAVVKLASIDCSLSLREVYDKVLDDMADGRSVDQAS
ncbi:MAG: Uma2 family endonuclease [Methylovulum sp.]|uniref:Uma2 family endonuclease n=1 Tax=Methylovulum sp. TaxID=1916980 RepID=UPI0026259662|nr:Uma2 family endonuclease [Methylovulum sp.]MDD2722946.1 Uma2 family endonuclease [Methylovulum sp.]MDD5123259.1 Uma2 family endonuclease [Methylovulum sp.]